MDSQHPIEAAVAASAAKITYAGAATTSVGGWLNNETAVLVGVVLGVLGFAVNLIFQWRRDRREAALADARMAQLGAYE